MGIEAVNAASCRAMANCCRLFPSRTFTRQAEQNKAGKILPSEARMHHHHIGRLYYRSLNK
jgi:hypothetical protein